MYTIEAHCYEEEVGTMKILSMDTFQRSNIWDYREIFTS